MSYANFMDRSGPGGVVHNPASAYSREMAKHEMGYSPFGPPGRPRELVGQPQWPAMFYKMKRSAQNGSFVVEHCIAVEEEEAPNFLSRGYRQGRAAAEAFVAEQEQELAMGAAIRNKQDLNMSDKAKAEAAAFEATTLDHVAEIPATPIAPKRQK